MRFAARCVAIAAVLAALAGSSGNLGIAAPGAGDRVVFASDRDSWQLFAVGLDGTPPRQISNGLDNKREPAWSPDGRTIAFVSDRDGDPHVYLASPGGTGEHRLSRGSGVESSPTWSPDSRFLAFARGGDLIVARADGGGERTLVEGPYDAEAPAWAPDGRRIAFLFGCTPYLVDAAGGEPEKIWVSPPCSTRMSWAPSGTTLTSNLFAPPYGGAGIYIFSVDGKVVRLLAHPNRLDGAQPAWSPDGRLIAFSTLCVRCDSPVIEVVGTNGRGERALTKPRRHHDERQVGDLDPAWSPDGRTIVFSRNLAGTSQIYAANADGTGVRRLSRTQFTELRPAPSPDGKTVAFLGRPGGEGTSTVLHLMDTRGRNIRVRRVPAHAIRPLGSLAWAPDSRRLALGTEGGLWILDTRRTRWRRVTPIGFDPSWSPTGNQIAFSTPIRDAYDIERETDIWIVGADGRGRRRLSSRCSEGGPDWSPDGREIAFHRAGSIYAMRPDGSGVRLVLPAVWTADPQQEPDPCSPPLQADVPKDAVYFDPEWSPDGTKLAAHSLSEYAEPWAWESAAVFVADRDGGNRRRIADGGWPAWITS